MNIFMIFWMQLFKNVESFAADNWEELKVEVVEDSKKFLTDTKDDFQRWISLLSEGKLTSDDLSWLIKGKRDLAELLFLKAKGLAKPDLDKFFHGLTETVLSTALKLII
jgi:hypothetical protein